MRSSATVERAGGRLLAVARVAWRHAGRTGLALRYAPGTIPDRAVRHPGGSSVIVPELPADIAELKRQIGDFIEAEVYPVELKIAERNAIDTAEVDALRAKARAAGFSMLNMPKELGGRDLSMLAQVALEEESGKATNGLGFTVVDRGPASCSSFSHRIRSRST